MKKIIGKILHRLFGHKFVWKKENGERGWLLDNPKTKFTMNNQCVWCKKYIF